MHAYIIAETRSPFSKAPIESATNEAMRSILTVRRSTAPARAATRVALQARPVPDHREVVALGAGDAFVAAKFGFRDALLEEL